MQSLLKGRTWASAPSKLSFGEHWLSLQSRKPIYDDFEAEPAPSAKTVVPTPSSGTSELSTKPRSPTPTDRLAVQIGKTRLFLHGHVAAAENKVNEFMDSVLHLEESFTSTIASLAPPPQSGEKLMPGSLYVLVAAMTGSIVSRNRNVLLRATVPGSYYRLRCGMSRIFCGNTSRDSLRLLMDIFEQERASRRRGEWHGSIPSKQLIS